MKEFGVLLDPLETDFEASKTIVIDLGTESRITNVCDDSGDFGRQGIKTQQNILGKNSEEILKLVFIINIYFQIKQFKEKSFIFFLKSLNFRLRFLI